MIITDHKSLVFVFRQRSEKAFPIQLWQLSFIAQFTIDIEFLKKSDNVVADSLSQIEALRLPVEFELNDLAARQSEDNELKNLLT